MKQKSQQEQMNWTYIQLFCLAVIFVSDAIALKIEKVIMIEMSIFPAYEINASLTNDDTNALKI